MSGMLVRAHWQGRPRADSLTGRAGRLLVHDATGQLLGSTPSNVCRAGPNLDVLVTSNLGRWH
ncbi:MAG TPA: hypothetical protein VFI28_10390, partial [Candidatus Limnocylindrales bacterium]|nr:hypothetical protein [Candidatus Limnocylindrales bacterium]